MYDVSIFMENVDWTKTLKTVEGEMLCRDITAPINSLVAVL